MNVSLNQFFFMHDGPENSGKIMPGDKNAPTKPVLQPEFSGVSGMGVSKFVYGTNLNAYANFYIPIYNKWLVQVRAGIKGGDGTQVHDHSKKNTGGGDDFEPHIADNVVESCEEKHPLLSCLNLGNKYIRVLRPSLLVSIRGKKGKHAGSIDIGEHDTMSPIYDTSSSAYADRTYVHTGFTLANLVLTHDYWGEVMTSQIKAFGGYNFAHQLLHAGFFMQGRFNFNSFEFFLKTHGVFAENAIHEDDDEEEETEIEDPQDAYLFESVFPRRTYGASLGTGVAWKRDCPEGADGNRKCSNGFDWNLELGLNTSYRHNSTWGFSPITDLRALLVTQYSLSDLNLRYRLAFERHELAWVGRNIFALGSRIANQVPGQSLAANNPDGIIEISSGIEFFLRRDKKFPWKKTNMSVLFSYIFQDNGIGDSGDPAGHTFMLSLYFTYKSPYIDLKTKKDNQ